MCRIKKDGKKLVKYNTHLVLKGFGKKQWIDFDEIFSLSVKTIYLNWVIRGLVVILDLKHDDLDVKIAFLHSDLEEDFKMLWPK